jgi:hypothetical protein
MIEEDTWRIAYNFVKDPDFMDIRNLPLVLKKAVGQRLCDLELGDPHYGKVLEWMYMKDENPTAWSEFCEHTKALDKIRGQCFQSVYPEFSREILKATLHEYLDIPWVDAG